MDDATPARIVQGALLSLVVVLLAGMVIGPVAAARQDPLGDPAYDRATLAAGDVSARSVILLVGDGMGSTQVEAARWEKAGHDPAAYRMTTLAMDSLTATGSLTTTSANNAITDSAAAATALMTGTRTDNGVIGQDATAVYRVSDGVRLDTIAELARARGKATGAVTTTRITHATPAGVYAHVNDRDNELLIASQFLDSRLDVALGGGYDYFIDTTVTDPFGSKGLRTDGRDLISAAKARGYTVVTTASGLSAVPATSGTKVLGLFASQYLNRESLRAGTQQPSLSAMTAKALAVLSTDPDGFVLMVEGGQIDTAATAGNYAYMTGETLAFDDAVATAKAYASAHPDTLLIVTADHETGGLAMTTSSDGTLAFSFTSAGHTATHVPVRASGPAATRFGSVTAPNTLVFTVMRDALRLGGGTPAPSPTPTRNAVAVIGAFGPPTDIDADRVYEDVNGNSRSDFADAVLYFDRMDWIAANEPVAAFDCNRNGRIDYADVVWLFEHL